MDARRTAFVGVGIVFAVLGATRLYLSTDTAPTGRWAFVFGPIYKAFGPYGLSTTFIALGVVFMLIGVLLKEKK